MMTRQTKLQNMKSSSATGCTCFVLLARQLHKHTTALSQADSVAVAQLFTMRQLHSKHVHVTDASRKY